MRSDRERLLDIQEAIDRIDKYTIDQTNFTKDELVQTWVVHHLQIIGEAARAISSEFRETHSAIPWRKIIGMRHILVHSYFSIDEDIVWSVIEKDLPTLKSQIEHLLNQLPAE